MIMLNEHKSPQHFHIRKLDNHAYFIPFTDKTATTGKRQNSPFFINPNDNRGFLYYDAGWSIKWKGAYYGAYFGRF